jgi:hypothetical protein
MAALEKAQAAASFFVSEANGYRSRATGTVVGGAAPGLPAGQVLGRLTANGNYVAFDSGAATGAEDVAGILYEGAVGTVDRTIVDNDAEVTLSDLAYTTAQEAAVISGLAALGIKVR